MKKKIRTAYYIIKLTSFWSELNWVKYLIKYNSLYIMSLQTCIPILTVTLSLISVFIDFWLVETVASVKSIVIAIYDCSQHEHTRRIIFFTYRFTQIIIGLTASLCKKICTHTYAILTRVFKRVSKTLLNFELFRNIWFLHFFLNIQVLFSYTYILN